jgi:hypothetical protein
MAEESSETKITPQTKLEIDRPQDFKFHIAYDVYSRAWDDNIAEEAREKLNELITALADGKAEYQDFYSQVQGYRKDVDSFRSGRTRIRTERKRSWQSHETRDSRNRRHK